MDLVGRAGSEWVGAGCDACMPVTGRSVKASHSCVLSSLFSLGIGQSFSFFLKLYLVQGQMRSFYISWLSFRHQFILHILVQALLSYKQNAVVEEHL